MPKVSSPKQLDLLNPAGEDVDPSRFQVSSPPPTRWLAPDDSTEWTPWQRQESPMGTIWFRQKLTDANTGP